MTQFVAFSLSLRQLYHTGRLSQYLLLLACVAAVVGLFASRALVALSPIVGFLAAAAQPELASRLRGCARLRTVLIMGLLYLFWLLSLVYTSELAIWRHEVYRKLPLLAVPLAFAVAVPLSARQRYGVGLLYVGLATALALGTLGRYLLNPAEANYEISIGHNVPAITGIFHIHFSIMLALAFFFALLMRRSPLATAAIRWGLLACAVALCLIMHVLAYRTGLLVLYGMLLIDAVLLILLQRRFVLGSILLVVLTVLPPVAYFTLAPIQHRVSVSLDDLNQYKSGRDINDYSMAKRFAAWETAIIIAREHPLLGVGPADVDAAMINQYEYQDFGLQPRNWVMTHNQYLEALVGGGIVGLTLWLLVLFGPLVQPALRQNPYVVHFLLMMAIANLVDSLLQMQIGFNMFVFLYGFLVVAAERQARLSASLPPRLRPIG
ncbi:O-antigen ligase family protein [Hymenobacter psychrotolerans]|uniref:O-antigen ligase n=1 Tax=Hymenobacter psychrotolerans DSM 18569 TaxID=1121959 RepID=A0A1M6R931_9BACT|nr:O-antigen ligase family protein [Hymenobacter psychrotolerans]SHK28989.1 O-antigen ligase [Hymenobacter psychrotolerans DSM 18569]